MNTILTDDEIEDAWCKYGDEMGGADQSDALRIGREIEAAVLAKLREQEPVAWLYKGDPWFDGNRWQEQAGVTLDKRIAEIRGGIKPLYAAPLPAVVQVPQGWRLVPVEPTPEMLAAVVTSMDEALHGPNAEKQYVEDWKAMLAAAPESTAQAAETWRSMPAGPFKALHQARHALLRPAADGLARRCAIDAIDEVLAAPETQAIPAPWREAANPPGERGIYLVRIGDQTHVAQFDPRMVSAKWWKAYGLPSRLAQEPTHWMPLPEPPAAIAQLDALEGGE